MLPPDRRWRLSVWLLILALSISGLDVAAAPATPVPWWPPPDPDSGAAQPTGEPVAPLFAVGSTVDTLVVNAPEACLGHGFIKLSSLEVRRGQRLLSERDFAFDARTGCLAFHDPKVWLGTTLVVRYDYFPFPLQSEYSRRTPMIAAALPPDTTVTIERRVEEEPASPGGTGLSVRGYKTFAVRVGSGRDATLNQALDLDVSGEIADGVELRALLSDRDLPLQAQGNTETLNDLDKVLLEVRTRTMSATLGDYEIRTYGGDFLTYSKRLAGLKAEAQTPERGFLLAAAVSRGEFTSLELNGVEGKQGPYVLTDPGGSDLIQVIAASEAVWIDGQRLVRGQNQDYVIDYARAEITFTSRRPITADSRLTVDFEFSTQSYERNFYVGAARASFLRGALDVGASLVSEADDDANPISQLSADERALLSSAGDSTRAISEAAGVFVGEGNGDYLALELGEGRVRYQYAGASGGDHSVRFVDVGPSGGEYQDSTTVAGLAAYRYVGVGNGEYQPARTLAAPVAHRIANFTTRYQLENRLTADLELAVSGLDLNTLSTSDDRDNSGSASKVRLLWSPWGTVGSRGLSLRAGYRDVGSTFESLGRIRPADYTYDWNAPLDAFAGAERTRDAGLDWRLARGVTVGGELADTHTPSFDGERRRLTGRLERRQMRGSVIVERVDGVEAAASAVGLGADRNRALEIAEVGSTFGRFEPLVRFHREQRTEMRSDRTRDGTVFERLDASGAFTFWRGGRLVVGGGRRQDRALATGTPWTDVRRSREQRYQLEMPRIANLTLSGSVTRRVSETVATGDEQISDLVKIDLVSTDLNGGLETELHYDVTTTDVAQRGRELVFVGEGEGLYDQFGRFVGTGGDYDLRASSDTDSDLRTRVVFNLRAELRPRRIVARSSGEPGRLMRILAHTGYETTLFVDELSRRNLGSPRLFFDPSNYQRRDSTFDGAARLRQDVDLFEGNRAATLRLRYERSDRADNRTGAVFADSGDESLALRLRSSPRRSLSLEWSGTLGRSFAEESSLIDGSVAAASRLDFRNHENRFEVTVRPNRVLRAGAFARRRLERDRPSGAEIRTLEIGPSVTFNQRRVRSEFRLRFTDERQTGQFPRFLNALTLPGRSTEYDVNLDYRATQYVTLTAGVDGLGRPEQDFVHTARMELRASF